MGFLNNDGVIYLWSKVKALFNKGITDIYIKDTTVTITKGDGSKSTQTTKDTKYGVVSKTEAGLAPQLPNETATTKYLRQDGTWVAPPNDNTTYSDATQENHGLMSAADKKKLDGVETGANKYVHPATSGNKHIPSGGASGKILRWSADGTAEWGDDEDTTYDVFGDGKNGLVPATTEAMNGFVLAREGWSELSFTDGTTDPGDNKQLFLSVGDFSGMISLTGATTRQAGLMTASDKTKLDGLPTGSDLSETYAKKSDIVSMYKYRGSVADASKLPTTGQVTGDVYNIESASKYGGAGMNVAWNGTEWDPLGENFTITAITNAELDTICV